MAEKQKIVIIGAGPVGALAAIYAAERGNDVEIYELRGDLRHPSTTPLNFTKSINLALSERGINAMRLTKRPVLLDSIMKETIPMRGRMIHGISSTGELFEEPQDYDVHGRAIYAVDRGGLNKRLLDELNSMPNVKLHFNHKLVGADLKENRAWFEQYDKPKDKNSRPKEIEIDFDLLIGADGAHSAVRYHLMKFQRMNYQQEYIDTLWCEFHIEARHQDGENPDSKFAISPHHLHIWPGRDYMFIAIPSLDGSFTCTLFMPPSLFASLEADTSQVLSFFDKHFPGVTDLIPESALISSFQNNPHLPLISIKASPYHFSSSCVILGDAAHAMVPFYGQGMNAGLEDVRVLFETIDKHLIIANYATKAMSTKEKLAAALAEYSELHAPDSAAINDLALSNYEEMRSSVTSSVYLFRKHLEEWLSVNLPRLGWATKYSRVSFSNERYSEIVRRSDRQGQLLLRGLVGVMFTPIIIGGLTWWYRSRHVVRSVGLLARLRSFLDV